jgi:hypothetical protein
MFAPTDDFLSRACAGILLDLGPRPDVAAACAALDAIFALAEQSWQGRRTSLDYIRSAPPVACKAGCGWCCHQQVGITPVEAVGIAAHLDALPADQGGPLKDAVRALDRKTRGLTTAARAQSGLACAFLGPEGSCRIYPVRPLRCRGLHSVDADFCAASYRDPAGMRSLLEQGKLRPVFLSVPEAIFDSALSGVLMASKRLKWAMVSLELTAAVAALLDQPRLTGKWLAGARPDRSLALVA